MIINWRWFISKSLRDACEERKQVIKLLSAQKDLLKPSSIREIEEAIKELDIKGRGKLDRENLKAARENLLTKAEQNLAAYPNAKYRDWVEMFLVVATLVLTFRSFFFQPFKIPTGSMQPTLYGITAVDNNKIESGDILGKIENGILTTSRQLIEPNGEPESIDKIYVDAPFFVPEDKGRIVSLINDKKDIRILDFVSKNEVKVDYTSELPPQPIEIKPSPPPSLAGRVLNKLKGLSYHSLIAEGNWTLKMIHPPQSILPLITKQVIEFIDESGNVIKKTIWFPPVRGNEPLINMAPVMDGRYIPQSPRIDHTSNPVSHIPIILKSEFKSGDYVFNIQVKTGDHLFVNRMTYNFRKPKRGDIAVFTISQDTIPSRSFAAPKEETFYIKRLVALGGDNLSLGSDNHLIINEQRLDANNQGFEFIYSHPKTIGSNGDTLTQNNLRAPENSIYSGHTQMSNLSSNQSIEIKPGHYYMLGDNTTNSRDSREWGELPYENVIGHSSFVYWPPLSSRFGWSHR